MPKTIKVSFNPSVAELRRKFEGVDIDKFLGRQVQKIAFRIEGESKRVTPVDTGRLRSSIRTYIGSSGLRAVIKPNVDYDIFVHEGTRFMKARPFMMWGVEKAVVGFEDSFTRELDKYLQDKLR